MNNPYFINGVPMQATVPIPTSLPGHHPMMQPAVVYVPSYYVQPFIPMGPAIGLPPPPPPMEFGDIYLFGHQGLPPPPFYSTFGTPFVVNAGDPLNPAILQPVGVQALNYYAHNLSCRMEIMLTTPITEFITDISLPPHFAITYSLIKILERNSIESGIFKVDYVRSPLMKVCFKNIANIYAALTTSELFYTLETVIDMADTLLKNVARSPGTLNNIVNSSLQVLPEVGCIKCLNAIQMGFRAIEKFHSETGGEVTLDMNKVLSRTLALSSYLTFIKDPELECAFLDICGEIGPGFDALIIPDLLFLVVNKVLDFHYEPTNPNRYSAARVAAQAGRTMGKLLHIERMISTPRIIDTVFISGFKNLRLLPTPIQPTIVRANWSWALAEMSQTILASNRPISNAVVKKVIEFAGLINQGIIKGRYNGYRACGNVFTMMCPPGHGTDEEAVVIFQLCVNLVYDLLEQIGTGQDYKNRWNAAFGLGCIFQNYDFAMYLVGVKSRTQSHSILDEVVIALSWAVKISQNYKEKIQCLLGLKRISARAMLGTSMNTVLSNICLALVLAVCSLTALLNPEDHAVIETQIFPFFDRLKPILRQMTNLIVGDRVDIVGKARDRMQAIRNEVSPTIKEMISVMTSYLGTLIGEEVDLFDYGEEEIDDDVNVARFNMLTMAD
ncbi:HEAT repeat-containing protein 6 [Folsomia candida]|uniref:HEAT repeat-containing protein 6 n=1 Tax=Folsomia candida TaxID=158441 RepID=A0A226CVI2_FOLCA|nr:HEAT repeat-containing protein 6 [Folsomia candida]